MRLTLNHKCIFIFKCFKNEFFEKQITKSKLLFIKCGLKKTRPLKAISQYFWCKCFDFGGCGCRKFVFSSNNLVLKKKMRLAHKNFPFFCCFLCIPTSSDECGDVPEKKKMSDNKIIKIVFVSVRRLFKARCARCQSTIPASELVMRARDLVFHLQCFTCALCAVPLSKGDHFGLRDGAVLCRLHYEVASPPPPQGTPPNPAQSQPPVAAAAVGPQPASEAPPAPTPLVTPLVPPPMVPPPLDSGSPPPPPAPGGQPPPTNPADFPPAFRLPMGHLGPHAHSIPHPHLHPHHHHPLQHPLAHLPHSGDPNAKMPFFNGGVSPVGPTGRQKGRPRKRKPKDMEAMTANLGELQPSFFRPSRKNHFCVPKKDADQYV